MSEVEGPKFVMSQDKFLSSSGQRSSTCRVMTPRPSSSRQFFGLLQPLMRFIWPSLTGLTPIVERQHIILVDQGLCEGKSIAMLHLR